MATDELIVNGVKIGDGANGPGDGVEKTVDLPSGSRAVIRAGKGRDLMRAQRAAAGGGVSAVAMALIAELAVIDNRNLVYEDVLEMELADVMALEAEILGGNFSFPPRSSTENIGQCAQSPGTGREIDKTRNVR
ncbi:MAG: hypothetical protein ACREQI_11750 [Candidatus Binataceae bacterium]